MTRARLTSQQSQTESRRQPSISNPEFTIARITPVTNRQRGRTGKACTPILSEVQKSHTSNEADYLYLRKSQHQEHTVNKQSPLWEKLYFDAVYVEIARLIGYQGTTYRDMLKLLEPLEEKFGKQRVRSAAYHVVTFEGQMTCNPKPLAEVKLRENVRKLCWQLLGPPPESEAAFFKDAVGSPKAPKGKRDQKQKKQQKK